MFEGAYREPADPEAEARRHASIVLTFGGLASGDAYADGGRRIGEITQTALAVAEGAIRGYIRFRGGKQPVAQAQFLLALLRWASVQGVDLNSQAAAAARVHGWLARQPAMRERRPRGNTARQALAAATPEHLAASNESKGSACLPRAAACSLLYPDGDGPAGAFTTGAESAAVTHGHPVAQVSAGVFAVMLRLIREGNDVRAAATRALGVAREADPVGGAQAVTEVEHHVTTALGRSEGGGTYSSASEFGWHGRTAEQALAIAIWAVAGHESPTDVLDRATKHGGERHATGAAAGALWGALAGCRHADRNRELDLDGRAAPQPLDELPEQIRPRGDDLATVESVAEDLVRIVRSGSAIEYADWVRWPGY